MLISLVETLSTFLLSNKIEPNMQHCYSDLDQFINLVVKNKYTVYWSPKIDGVRCWIVIDKHTIPEGPGKFRKIARVKYISRNGKEFFNFKTFDRDFIEIAHILNRKYKIKYPIILDCEVSSRDMKINTIMTQLRRTQNVDTSIFIFNIFDLVHESLEFSKRHELVRKTLQDPDFRKINYYKKNIKLLPYTKLSFTRPSDLENKVNKLLKKMISNKYEGVMLYIGESKYQFNKRTRLCCKVKEFYTEDLLVIGVEYREDDPNKVAAFICRIPKTNKIVKVGSGLNEREREEFAKDPPIGYYIEVKYKEKTPSGSLRHPTFIRVRYDLPRKKIKEI